MFTSRDGCHETSSSRRTNHIFIFNLANSWPKSQREPSRELELVAGEDVARCVARLIPTFLRIGTQRSPRTCLAVRTRRPLLCFVPPTAGMSSGWNYAPGTSRRRGGRLGDHAWAPVLVAPCELQAVRREYKLLFFYSGNLLTKVTLNCVNVDGDDKPGGGDFRADAARILS